MEFNNNFNTIDVKSFEHCRNCTQETGRGPRCHNTCEYYIKDKERWQKQKDAENKKRYYDNSIQTVKINGIRRMKDKDTRKPKISAFKPPKYKVNKNI